MTIIFDSLQCIHLSDLFLFCDRRSSVAGTPTDVTAIRSNYNSVLVSWTAPLNPPAGYEVFYQMSAGSHTRLSAGNTSDTELTVTGLTLGVTYHIFVVSYGAEEAPILPSDHSMSAVVMLRESMQLFNIKSIIQSIILYFLGEFACLAWKLKKHACMHRFARVKNL